MDKTTVFIQDGTLPHIARCVKKLLLRHFGDVELSAENFYSLASQIPRLESLRFLALGIPKIHYLQ